MIKTEYDFYEAVVYAYMVDQILKEHPEFNNRYKDIWAEKDEKYKELLIHYPTKERNWDMDSLNVNYKMVIWYRDYLREQADPGCLAREEAQRKKELQDSINQHAAFARMEEEQHPHVECPYCHSKDTEKISTISRAVSISLVGAASGKIGKQWHCNNCKSNF